MIYNLRKGNLFTFLHVASNGNKIALYGSVTEGIKLRFHLPDMSDNHTDFSLEHYCNGQKFHLGSDGSCHLQNPAGLSRNLLEEERIKNGSLLKEIKKVKMIKKENLVGFNGHRNSKKY